LQMRLERNLRHKISSGRDLSPAARDPAVQFALLAASDMFANERLEHFREPRGKPLGSDTLGCDAGALECQEDFVGETLRIGEPRIAA
jgi:hypothetical protein